MAQIQFNRIRLALAYLALSLVLLSCTVGSKNEIFFGTPSPPERNILRYVSGDEPGSLDPQIGSLQSEARIYMSLFEGLVEYDPKTLDPMPALAEKWHVNDDSSEFIFHLRKDARWSNGDRITAHDFVYSVRRGLSPELASVNASFAYYIKYAQAYNEGDVFVNDGQKQEFLLAKDFAEPEQVGSPAPVPLSEQSQYLGVEYKKTANFVDKVYDTEFHQRMHDASRLILPGNEKSRNNLLSKNKNLQLAIADKEFIKVRAEDIGVEALDDYTLRISLTQSAPFFLGLIAHQFFRLVPQKIVEQYGNKWTDPAVIVTCGPFKVKEWTPYHELVVERDPMYWDSANVQLDEIHFYPIDNRSTMMNLYKAGEVDAVMNHGVPTSWVDVMVLKKDYMDGAEAAIDYLLINTTKPPMNDVRVRKAFNLAIDKTAWATWKKIVKPLTTFMPEGIFDGYPQPKGDQFDPERARKLLAESGYDVLQRSDGTYDCNSFPIEEVEFFYNAPELNRSTAEFMQAQWKQNLGITVPLRNMETRTFNKAVAKLEYAGFARFGYGADYMDPFTFLSLFYTPGGNNGTGWWDQKYAALLDEANRSLNKERRYELLARAEAYMLEQQPIIPLDSPAVNWLKKPYVKGMYPNAGSLFPWKYVYIERDPAKWGL